MDLDLQLNFTHIPDANRLRRYIEKQAKKLERHPRHINQCHVTIDLPQHHRYPGNIYKIQIEVETDKNRIVVNRNPSIEGDESSIYKTIHDAFAEADDKLNCIIVM